MNCLFCQQTTKKGGHIFANSSTFICVACKAYFTVVDETTHIRNYHFFSLDGKGRNFLFYFNIDGGHFEIEYFTTGKTLLKLPFIPDFTPQNAQAKMASLMAFL